MTTKIHFYLSVKKKKKIEINQEIMSAFFVLITGVPGM